MVFDNLRQSAHVIDEVCHGYVCLRPHYADTSEDQPPHALLHVSEVVLHPAANFRLLSVRLLHVGSDL